VIHFGVDRPVPLWTGSLGGHPTLIGRAYLVSE
jgi:hypothetical protein